MIPCSKLTDRWGRKFCFTLGLILYGIGALLSALSPNLGVLILGNSIFEGVGTAFLIPPVYILTTLTFSQMSGRAHAFGVISGMGGVGAAAGPLIGGLITTAISWRAAFIFQAAVVFTIVILSRRVVDPLPADPKRPFDIVGAILSAVGLFFIVSGILLQTLTSVNGGAVRVRNRVYRRLFFCSFDMKSALERNHFSPLDSSRTVHPI
jgi:MFS family permease